MSTIIDDLRVHRQVAITCETAEIVRKIGKAVLRGEEKGKGGKYYGEFERLLRREMRNRNLRDELPGPGYYHDGIKKYDCSKPKMVSKMKTPHIPKTKQAIYDKNYGVDTRQFLHGYSSMGKQVLSKYKSY